VNDSSQSRGGPAEESLARRSVIVSVILVVSFIVAAAVRLYNIDAAKLYFYATRPYYSFCIARHFYYEGTESIPDWKRDIAAINKEALDDKEPPLTEYLVSRIWRACRSENHWAPSFVCSIFWLIGGIFVFLIAKKYTTVVAAAIATAFYLLCPFGIVMSRSFQPESLMTMMFLAGIYTIFNYYEKPSTKRLFIMAIVSGLAILAKVLVIFPIWAAFIAAGICKKGFRKTIVCDCSEPFIDFILLDRLAQSTCLCYRSGSPGRSNCRGLSCSRQTNQEFADRTAGRIFCLRPGLLRRHTNAGI